MSGRKKKELKCYHHVTITSKCASLCVVPVSMYNLRVGLYIQFNFHLLLCKTYLHSCSTNIKQLYSN